MCSVLIWIWIANQKTNHKGITRSYMMFFLSVILDVYNMHVTWYHRGNSEKPTENAYKLLAFFILPNWLCLLLLLFLIQLEGPGSHLACSAYNLQLPKLLEKVNHCFPQRHYYLLLNATGTHSSLAFTSIHCMWPTLHKCHLKGQREMLHTYTHVWKTSKAKWEKTVTFSSWM